MSKLNKIFFTFLFCCTNVYAQTNGVNAVVIQATDDSLTIIKKAANVVPTARQLRWQQLELVAFFHFGINTFTNKEWGTGKENPALFNPTSLNVKQWVRVAKEAGFKQVIFTAKHHDGFCLWPTKTTQHSVVSSPWKNGQGDVVKEIAEACKVYGMGFGIYLSPWDMNATSYGTEAYNDFFTTQLSELLSNYGRIDEVWFDGANGEGPNGKKQVYDFDRWYKLIRKLQPSAVIAIMGPDVRWVGTETGYGRDEEWSVVPANNLDEAAIAGNSQTSIAFKPEGDRRGDDLGSRAKIMNAKGLVWYPAETDVSIRPGWFYHPEEDNKVKSPEKLLDIYFNSVGKNSVLLVNIPPDKNGLINDADIKSLKEWTRLREGIFKQNFAKGAAVFAKKDKKIKNILDADYKTYYTTKGKDTSAIIELRLKKKYRFNILMLQENISVGQRIEKFKMEYWDGAKWVRATEGTTVGYKRLLKFKTVTTKKIRLNIISARLNPTIAEIGLFKQEDSEN